MREGRGENVCVERGGGGGRRAREGDKRDAWLGTGGVGGGGGGGGGERGAKVGSRASHNFGMEWARGKGSVTEEKREEVEGVADAEDGGDGGGGQVKERRKELDGWGGGASLLLPHTLSIVFRHLPPKEGRRKPMLGV